MTNISKKGLPIEIQEKLFNQFTQLFSNISQNKANKLFDSMFTEVEKIMFIKRLAMILMLSEGYSTYAIAKALSVSDSTVRVQRDKLHAGVYDMFVKSTKEKQFDNKNFWSTVDSLLRIGLPTSDIKSKWKFLNTKN